MPDTAVLDRPATLKPEAHLPPVPATLRGYDGPTDMADRKTGAELLATARLTIHPMYRGQPGDCFALFYRAGSLNVPVGVAIDHVFINTGTGKAGLSAQLMAALLRRAGITWKTPRADDQAVEMVFYRGRKKIGSVTWRILEAVAAGLTKRDHWRLWPEDCLWARALARGCRKFFSHVVMGLGYTREEVFDATDGDTAPEHGESLAPAVEELLEQAASESATAHHIRTGILADARKQKVAKLVLPDGRTVEQALLDVWRVKVAQEKAAAADAALTNLGAEPTVVDAAAILDAPAGEGALPCTCLAADILAGKPHTAGTCTDVRAST